MPLFGLLGFPLGHSFSKTYFTEKFKAEKIDAEFVISNLPILDRHYKSLKHPPR